MLQRVEGTGESPGLNEWHRKSCQIVFWDDGRRQTTGKLRLIGCNRVFEDKACYNVSCDKRVGERVVTTTAASLCKQDVKAEHADPVVIEESIDNRCERRPLPGPLSQLQLACLIDIDNYDAIVNAAGHGQANANVIQVVLHPVDNLESRAARDMCREQGEHGNTDQDPDQ